LDFDYTKVTNICYFCIAQIKKSGIKNGQAPFIAPLNLLPLLCSHPGGVQRELVVKDLPGTKVEKKP